MPRTSRGNIEHIFENNRIWVSNVLQKDPEFFTRWADFQKPEYMWLGCSDSRVVAEAATGLGMGEVFVHRNVGNVLAHADNNAMSALEYSVKVLGVKHVLVCGHKNCGAIKAALTLPSSSPLLTNCWIAQIRDIRNQHVDELVDLEPAEQLVHLTRLNVMKQVFNVCTSPVLQQMWEAGREVFVHGLFYDVSTGALQRLVGPISSNDQVPEHLETSDGFAADGIVEGHTLAQAIKRIAAALANKPDAYAAQLPAAGGLDVFVAPPPPARLIFNPSPIGGVAAGPLASSASVCTRPFDQFDHQMSADATDALADILTSNGWCGPPAHGGIGGSMNGHLASTKSRGSGGALLEEGALESALSIAVEARRWSTREEREDLESKVLRQMQRHVAFEAAAKKDEGPMAALAERGAAASGASGHTSMTSSP